MPDDTKELQTTILAATKGNILQATAIAKLTSRFPRDETFTAAMFALIDSGRLVVVDVLYKKKVTPVAYRVAG